MSFWRLSYDLIVFILYLYLLKHYNKSILWFLTIKLYNLFINKKVKIINIATII